MPATGRERSVLLGTPILDFLRPRYEERLTARGRYLLWTTLLLGLLGVDTRRSQVFVLFAVAAGTLAVAALYWLARAPRVRFECWLPSHATAGTPLVVHLRAQAPGRTVSDLRVFMPRPKGASAGLTLLPREAFLNLAKDKPTNVTIELLAARRGRYLLRGPTLRRTDPLGLVTGRAVSSPDETLIVYPRFYAMNAFPIPLGRRYQPGGIPLSSNLGESIEFVGTREYRPGDALRSIHWPSWAKRGEPVVKEYQEEYFCRIAIILDTFLPPRAGPAEKRGFEAAISQVASVADFFSRSEYVVDVLAAGPDLYKVSAGRSLAYLENILDVLACLEPCFDPPFRGIGPALFDNLSEITTVVAVLQDWDEARAEFLRRVRDQGTAVRIVIVREGPTTKPWAPAEELGEVSLMSVSDTERALRAGPSPYGAPPLPPTAHLPETTGV